MNINKLFLRLLGIILIFSISACGDDEITTKTPAAIALGTETTIISGPVSFDLRYVPAGTFVIGSSNVGGTAVPVHNVTLTKGFWMAETEVTYQLWTNVYTWATAAGYTIANIGTMGDGTGDTEQEPVTIINWRDAIVWCNALSQKLGLDPVYTYNGNTITNSSDANATACDGAVFNTNRNGYRLPTEAEWEYASRYKDGINLTPGDYASGATNDYNNAAACSNVAWWSVNSGSDTHPVGSKAANALGIQDMSGNVWEWCWDWYDAAYYDGGTMTDPTGSATGLTRMSRGGCWFHSGEYLRCSPSG